MAKKDIELHALVAPAATVIASAYDEEALAYWDLGDQLLPAFAPGA